MAKKLHKAGLRSILIETDPLLIVQGCQVFNACTEEASVAAAAATPSVAAAAAAATPIVF